MKMEDYATRVRALPPERRRDFYLELAHRLTQIGRGLGTEPNVSDAEKVTRLVAFQEILERVVWDLCVLQGWTEIEWPEPDLTATIACPAEVIRVLGPLLEWAVAQSYERFGSQ